MKRFRLHCPDMGGNGSLPSGIKLLGRLRQCWVASGIEAEESVREPRCTKGQGCGTLHGRNSYSPVLFSLSDVLTTPSSVRSYLPKDDNKKERFKSIRAHGRDGSQTNTPKVWPQLICPQWPSEVSDWRPAVTWFVIYFPLLQWLLGKCLFERGWPHKLGKSYLRLGSLFRPTKNWYKAIPRTDE